MNADKHKNFAILAFDLDGTLLGKPDATLRFRRAWNSIPDGSRPILCYSSGRTLSEARDLTRNSDLPAPDYLCCGVGTNIYDYRKKSVIKEFQEIFDDGWDLERVNKIVERFPNVERQPAFNQNAHKSSWYWIDADEEEIDHLRMELEDAGLDVSVIYSKSKILDILPVHADKGYALRWLLRKLRIPNARCLVAGDTGNDGAMFSIKGVQGVVVANAQPELLQRTVNLPVFLAEEPCADGVLEGMLHYGVIDELPQFEQEKTSPKRIEPELKRLIPDQAFKLLNDEEIDLLSIAYEKAVEVLRRNLSPMGFSACSLNDNEVLGTDENYRSVWGRDGSICVVGTLRHDDADVQKCQRATLVTLLDHLSPIGQVPANVRIDSGMPDYSGLGGICSIDSGLWAVIAFSEYVRHHRDLAFWREYRGQVDLAMRWLAAHDSNNDFLLEIPEAGDWTDLFGRSYNVLYDEVLWYHANVSYGLLLELAGEQNLAGERLRFARGVKNAILRKFWPTSMNFGDVERSFADVQSIMGDSQYLLAQVTPFDFNWRCDVYANILAFLFNVTDYDRARRTLRFLWAVGVNKPYPVINLYPAVSPGDGDWRSYYTVNQLNLQHHYHNGGVWPFVGARWVMFLNRLGLRDVAFRELLKLAELNRQGTLEDWEFTEWAHGVSGLPMGKRYQAWSAAEFINAFLTLRMDALIT